jgi:hypothetical protein
LRQAHLAACHLPADYDDLDGPAQQAARFATLHSWYDTAQPNVLVTAVDNLVAASHLWIEEYIKGSTRNRGKYFYRDPIYKYDMVRTAFGPPKVESEPSKTIITAPRGSTKTYTLIRQIVPMMITCRPFTEILVSEVNEDRTGEETTAIMKEFEENERIEEDFGGKGVLYPASNRGTLKWTSSWMDLIHHPGKAHATIRGYSWKSKQRGRHPIAWIIDDPEDPDRPMTAEERRVFWRMLFERGLPMLTRGGVFLWISTLILGGCCHQAMRVALESDKELQDELGDARFDDWKMKNYDLLQTREDGTVISTFSDAISVEAYAKKEQTLGKRAAMAELRGIATAAGEFVFPRDPFTHGYMHCYRMEGIRRYEYFLDLVTGEQMPWDKFLAGLYRGQATDIANGTGKDADYGACVVVGVNGAQLPTFYVLDAFIKQVLSDELVWRSYQLAAEWECDKAGWEVGSMQNVVVRYAGQYAKRLEAEGQPVPQMVAISNHDQQKVPRIVASLKVLYAHRRIRFPYFGKVTDAQGVEHVPVEQPGKIYLKLLMNQLDYFTDTGASGPDDGPDALQMAVRILRANRGVEQVEEDKNAEEIRKWREQGVEFSHAAIPLEAWTPEMWQEHAPTCVPELHDLDDIYD